MLRMNLMKRTKLFMKLILCYAVILTIVEYLSGPTGAVIIAIILDAVWDSTEGAQ